MLKGSRLLDADVEVKTCVGDLLQGQPVNKNPHLNNFSHGEKYAHQGRENALTKIQVFFLTEVLSSWFKIVAGDTCTIFRGPLAALRSVFTYRSALSSALSESEELIVSSLQALDFLPGGASIDALGAGTSSSLTGTIPSGVSFH